MATTAAIVYREGGNAAVQAGLFVDVIAESLPRVQKILATIPGEAQKAVYSALKRAGQSGRTAVKQAIAQEYTISTGTFLKQTRETVKFTGSGGNQTVALQYKGNVIPLLEFETSLGRGGPITTRVRRDSTAGKIEHAFLAQISPRIGVYERQGPERHPLEEKYGPATPQMMYSNPVVMETLSEKVEQTYQQRIEHELLRRMNGW